MPVEPAAPAKAAPDASGLQHIRERIDTVDSQLLELLNQRAQCSLEVGAIKASSGAPIFRPAREHILLDELVSHNPGPLPGNHLRAIYREILSSSRALQRTIKVAYLGPEGNFSHMAGLEYLGSSLDFTPCASLQSLFAAVAAKECELGIVPLESARQGSLADTIDLFANHAVSIQAEWFSRNQLCLFSRHEQLEDISTLYAPPHLLAQCAGWIKRTLPAARQVPLESTLQAAHIVLEEHNAAAIGHNALAMRLGLHVLDRDLEDYASTWTRFCVIGPENQCASPEADKSSILFSLPDAPGSLGAVLQCFTEVGINLSKLESRFIGQEHNTYMFFADLACNVLKPECAVMLGKIRSRCHSLRILGVYLAGTQIVSHA